MISVTRLDGKKYVLNSELVESVESTPDTIITLTTGKKLVVVDSVDDIIEKIIQYKRKIFSHIVNIDRVFKEEV